MVIQVNNHSTGTAMHHHATAAQSTRQRRKLEVYNEVLHRLKDSGNEEALQPGFDDLLWAHFNRLPTRYALDVNVERAEDVLTHKRLLHLAHDPANRPAIEVRLVQVHPVSSGNSADSVLSDAPVNESDQSSSKFSNRQGLHPPPAFGSSHNLEALALEANNSKDMEEEQSVHASANYSR
ncbi:hypothetical protein Lalb_Chr06g0163821 [Lupinus albus]|uniref:Uncharacterized protein n=1 Tax=Lupinus albus TaxID=3870 RepID=A0A6A4QE99_LUPAL|nr:hypothetical protein Lalb_Chr06g0163821 [Lupinus albus]